MANVVGRDLWGRIESATGFEFYALVPVVLQEFPPVWNGLSAPNTFGSDGVKTVSGIQVRACTLAATRTFTVKADGLAQGTFTLESGLDDPADYTWAPTRPIEGVEFQLSVDSVQVELWHWTPIITARRPLGVLRWDSGLIDLGDRDLVWLRTIALKARVSAPITIDAYLDGRLIATQTSPALSGGADTIVPIDLPRSTKGRQPRLVVRSAGRFYPYWIKVTRRTSGQGSEKPTITVPVRLEELGRGVA
jgi:hypothetical protein